MRALPVIVSPEAELDIVGHRDWYRRERPEAESRFIAAVLEALDQAGARPETFAIIGHGIRHVRVRGFPYAAYFRILDSTCDVIAVLHDKQNPETWQSRA